MPFGVVGGRGPGIRQVVGLGIGPGEGEIWGENVGRSIETNGNFPTTRSLPRLLWEDLLSLLPVWEEGGAQLYLYYLLLSVAFLAHAANSLRGLYALPMFFSLF